MSNSITITLPSQVVALDDFTAALSEMSSLLTDLEREMGVTDGGWTIERLAVGSSTAEIVPRSVEGAGIVEACLVGLETLEHWSQQPRWFSDTALNAARRLSHLAERAHGVVIIGSCGNDVRRVSVSRRIGAHVDAVTAVIASAHWGAFEGRIETSSIHHHNVITIYDIRGKAIQCQCSEEDVLELARHLGKRVEVYGKVGYDKQGQIRTVKMERFKLLRDRADLPQPEDIFGLLADAPISAEEYRGIVSEDG